MFKRKAVTSSLLLFLNSILDLAGLASLLPLFSLILQDNFIENNKYASSLYNYFGLTNENQLIIIVASFVVLIIVIKNIISLLITKYQANFSFGIMKYSISRLHRIYYKKGFSYFKKTNSNVTLRDIYVIPSRFASTITMNLLLLFNEIVILILIITGILIYDIKIIALLTITVLPTFYIFYRLTKKKIKFIGDETNRLGPEISKGIFQSIFGYVDVTITGTKKIFFNKVKQLIKPLAKLNVSRTVYNLAPTKVIESAMILSVVMILIYGVYTFPTKEEVLTLLGIYALAAYRIMPSINRVMISINSLTENQYTFSVMEEIVSFDEKEESIQKDISFKEYINIEKVSFKYDDGEDIILSDFSLSIKKGETIGIRGKSGGGKTTLMNIMLGLLQPTSGQFKVDNTVITAENIEAWQRQIGYVQQDVYLLDATLAENIAFGIDNKNINFEKINKAIEQSSLKEFVDSLAQGIETKVGERGTQLSGGQKQRVGIARALYFDSEVLFFDEATSALDPQTEKEITESINRLSQEGLTMIIIAHRETSLEGADRIIEI